MKVLLSIIKIIFFVCIFFLSKSYSQQNWFWQNPLPQGNDLYAIQFVNENTGYASGYGFNILKTTNGGINWFSVSRIDSIPDYFSNLFFFNSETGFVGGNGLYKTTNGGFSWIYLNSLISVNSFSFADENTGYIVNENSLAKTTNGGFNWFLLPFSYLNSHLLKTVFTSRDTGFILTRFSSVYKTINGGVNWTESFFSSANHHGMFFCNSNTGYVVGDEEILKTTNGGNNWIYLLDGSFNYFGNVYFLNTNTGYITAHSDTQIIKTTNSGISFYTIFLGKQANGFSFVNENLGYIASAGGQILKTTNAGYNWQNIISNVTTEKLWNVYFTNENTGFITGNNNTLLRTTNAGGNWIKDSLPVNDNYGYLKFFNETNGIVAGSNILKTSDGGSRWDSVAYFSEITDFEAINVDTMYLTKGNSLYKSFNGGNNWSSQFVRPYLKGFYFDSDNDTGFAILDTIHSNCWMCPQYHVVDILKTTDNGNTWFAISQIVSTDGAITKIKFTSSNLGFMWGHGGLWRTYNGGINWYMTLYGYMDKNLYFFNRNIIYTYEYSNIIKSTNGGSSWNYLETFTGTLNSFFFTSANTGYVVGNEGKILKTTNGGGIFVGISNESQSVPVHFKLNQNYPNPFNPITRISFESPDDSKVKLTIYDILGREVKLLVNDKFSAGRYEFVFDGSNHASGIYFYRIEATENNIEKFVETKRMVLVK